MKTISWFAVAAILALTVVPLTQVNGMMEKMQKLTETSLPVTLPLTKGYVGGSEVFYISTEASDKDLADELTKITGARVAYTPALARTPPGALANIYAFKNGIEGTGPLGFQPNVADSQPGDAKYSPLWRISIVEWNSGVTVRELKSESEILAAQADNELTVTTTQLIVNCPFVKWSNGELQIRGDMTLTDETPYGGGQVLDIEIEKMAVTFVAHRGFAPNGSTIYYIATDASIKDVADALGVIFVEKTGATLLSPASSDLYVFTNGIKGTGPMGFQASIASTNVGDEFYSPMWRIQTATWKDAAMADFLTKLSEITSAGTDGKLTTDVAGVVVNCPFVEVSMAMGKNGKMGEMHGSMSMGEKGMMIESISLRGDLTAAANDKPFGGENTGNYIVRGKGDIVRIIASLRITHASEKVLEGWLVDMQSGYKLSIGKFSERNSIVFTQRMVNPWVYDMLVITEEPANDTDPMPARPVGGAHLQQPFGH
jgi:hypothetical protein